MRLRNNISGPTGFKSFIPAPIADYEYEADPGKIHRVTQLLTELGKRLSALPEHEKPELMRMEAQDSVRLADMRPANPFAFASPSDNEDTDNIVRATIYAADALSDLPLSTRLIRNIHDLICAGADYDRKYRGEYRTSPVWIGRAGESLANAEFVPPVAEDMTAAIADLENYVNYSDDAAPVKAAILHYQFEMIHPFIDGNGRTGRLLNNRH